MVYRANEGFDHPQKTKNIFKRGKSETDIFALKLFDNNKIN